MRKVCSLAVLASCLFVLNGAAMEMQLPVVGALREHFRNYDVRGEQYADGSIRIWVTTASGHRLFESRYPVVNGGAKSLQWKFEGESVVTQNTPIPDETTPTLEGMYFAGKDVVKMLGGGAKPPAGALIAAPDGQRFQLAPMDEWGCDDLQGLSCSPKGICCDIHDDCYEQNGCRALSWLGIGSPSCIACNLAVVSCFADSIHFGQSVCCVMGNCGQPYQPPQGGGEAYYDDRDPLNIDPSGGGYGGSGGFRWAWTPYGGVGIGYAGFCVINVGGQNVYVACG